MVLIGNKVQIRSFKIYSIFFNGMFLLLFGVMYRVFI